jgi:hypothetical protein
MAQAQGLNFELAQPVRARTIFIRVECVPLLEIGAANCHL